jgi:heterotetrameric sarcosine oxidase gamma subunit
VVAKPREGLGLANVIGAADPDALARRIGARYAVAPPAHPAVAKGDGCDLVWAGPGQWLVLSNDRGIADRLASELHGLAAVTDQSDGRAVLRLAGPRVHDALAKGCPIDLHPRVFRPGEAALTVIAHIGVHLWQLDEAPTYELAVFRSFAGSFWGWLSAAAAEFGLELRAESD